MEWIDAFFNCCQVIILLSSSRFFLPIKATDMKTFFIFLLLAFFIPSFLIADDSADLTAAPPDLAPGKNKTPVASKPPEGVKVVNGSMEYVACFSSGKLFVRDESLRNVLFKTSPNNIVKPFQGWGENKKKKMIDGREYFFIRAQFPEEKDGNPDEGWVPENFVKLKSQCASSLRAAEEERKRDEARPAVDLNITGLSDPNCCEFPINRSTSSFLGGMAGFGQPRARGRKHAACDLYQSSNSPILAVASGKVVRDLYKFYQGTWALEVKHQGGFVVRYGEMTGRSIQGLDENKKVNRGQQVGYMGKVNSNCCEPMLHFELYSGKETGSLSGGGRYQRRSDLINPTNYLLKWRKEKFRN